MTEEASGQTNRTATATKTESLLTWQHWCCAHSKSPNLILSSSPVLLLSTAIKISLWGLLVLESHFHGLNRLPAWTWEFKFCHRYYHPGSVDNGIAKKYFIENISFWFPMWFFKSIKLDGSTTFSFFITQPLFQAKRRRIQKGNKCFFPLA